MLFIFFLHSFFQYKWVNFKTDNFELFIYLNFKIRFCKKYNLQLLNNHLCYNILQYHTLNFPKLNLQIDLYYLISKLRKFNQ